ncbi:MAG: hypothetical protein WEB58_10780 [Planctomycetaceae bacterium]
MSLFRWAIAVLLCHAAIAAGAEPHPSPYRSALRYRSSYRQPAYRESPPRRERRMLSSPSLYAGPYPGGGLYAWRQWYYDRLRYPLFDRSRHRVFRILPFDRELSMSQSLMPGVMNEETDAAPDDPVTKLQNDFFTDDLHSPEDLLQLKLGY